MLLSKRLTGATLVAWLIAVVVGVSGCGLFTPGTLSHEILQDALASVNTGIANMEMALKDSNLSDAAQKGILATLASLKGKQLDLEQKIAKNSSLTNTETAGITGIIGLLLTLGINYFGLRGKLRRTRADLYTKA